MSEMNKLMNLLDNAKIPFEVRDCFGTPQVGYPSFGSALVCDVICHCGSYGGPQGLLEIMGLVDEKDVGDSVEGWLTADDVFERIKAHYKGQTAKTYTYTYDKNSWYYANRVNENVDYIIRNLPGVTVVTEKNNLVQVTAEKKAADVIEFFSDYNMLCLFVGQTIEEISEMIEQEE